VRGIPCPINFYQEDVMKISEMDNEQAANALIRIATPLGNICDDEQITGIITRYQEMEETPIIKVIAKFMPEIVSVAFKKHKNDLFEIVGALTLQSADKVSKMNFLQTINVIKDAINDEDMKGFFTSFKGQRKKREIESAQD
jgi:hypothetical protein